MGFTTILLYTASLPILHSITTGILHDIILYLHAIGLTWQLFSFTQSSSSLQEQDKDMYNLRHVTFNLEIPPKTLWFNMGLWYDDDNNNNKEEKKKIDNNKNEKNQVKAVETYNMKYSVACERLVEAVLEHIEMKPASRVLDVGYGCGDSCFLLADRYGCKVTGLTNEKSQWRISKRRLESMTSLQDRIHLICGSATDDDYTFVNNNNDDDDDDDDHLFDHIISIDSAYHYLTRWKFLQTAMTHLVPDGTLGLYDLTIHPNLLGPYGDNNNNMINIKKHIVELLGHYVLDIPKENMVTAEQYRDRLMNMGYDQVRVEPIDGDRVFGGLSRFIRHQYQQAEAWDILPPFGNRMFMLSSASLFSLLARKQWVVPVIVSARKKKIK